jgi:hypothetical protein
MCCPSCSITFWATECNTPNVFCLASYSTILLVSGFISPSTIELPYRLSLRSQTL